MKKLLLFLCVFFSVNGAVHSAGGSGNFGSAAPYDNEKTGFDDDESGFDENESDFSADERLLLEAGFASGRSEAYGHSGRWQVFVTYGVPLRPAWLVGLGAGVLYYPHLKKGFMPVYADFRFHFTPRNPRTPFIDFKVGYAFLLRERDEEDGYYNDDFYSDRIGGVFFSPSIGAQLVRFNGIALSVSGGYSFHKIDYRHPDGRYVERVGGFHFTVGIEF